MNRERAIQITYFLLRVVAGLMFMQGGGQKILGWFGGIPPEMGGMPAVMSQIWIGGMLELVGGFLIMVGLVTRPVAFVLAGEMAVAYWQFHFKGAPWDTPWTWPLQNQGVPAVLYCFVFLFMAAYGGGAWSLDSALWGKRTEDAGAGSSEA
jgi:putative oxidoreductase